MTKERAGVKTVENENKVLDELETALNSWIADKNTKEKGLRDELKEAQAGLDAATEDSDKYMKAGDLKKYTEAETRKGFYNKRINHLTNLLNDMMEKGYLTEAKRQQFIKQVNAEQNRIIREQREEMQEAIDNLRNIASDAGFFVEKGNNLITKLNTELMNEEENPYRGTVRDSTGDAVADNADYLLHLTLAVPFFRHNYRFSKFVGGAAFADEV